MNKPLFFKCCGLIAAALVPVLIVLSQAPVSKSEAAFSVFSAGVLGPLALFFMGGRGSLSGAITYSLIGFVLVFATAFIARKISVYVAWVIGIFVWVAYGVAWLLAASI